MLKPCFSVTEYGNSFGARKFAIKNIFYDPFLNFGSRHRIVVRALATLGIFHPFPESPNAGRFILNWPYPMLLKSYLMNNNGRFAERGPIDAATWPHARSFRQNCYFSWSRLIFRCFGVKLQRSRTRLVKRSFTECPS